ncbi:DNase I-like protein [Wolfiporia cocos MD-104 SS10]|uniref:DNase I-like protein n=1 Tax=Wolfiporia cocos (strain MD-104) TaxID=742152 RepID=A0A2H3JGE8_WOLCO|nr:DNase I-like protein [Wolfiporia cocos MD-104 SS10]
MFRGYLAFLLTSLVVWIKTGFISHWYAGEPQVPMRIASWNLRYDSQPDHISVNQSLDALPSALLRPRFLGKSGEQPWSTRRIKVAQQLLSERPTIIGFQEALVRQVNDLAELLGDEWAWLGVGRDDGKEAGEFCPIFYKKTELTLLEHESFWLSDDPFTPSKHPAAGSYRVCEVARFAYTPESAPGSAHTFTLINTHLDDRSEAARQLGASLLLARARFAAHATHAPVFVTGDFNSAADGADAGAYRIATGVRAPVRINETFAERYHVPDDEDDGNDGGRGGEDEDDGEEAPRGFVLRDLMAETPRMRVAGDYATFTGFNRPGDPSVYTRIDFVFGGSSGGWSVEAYKVGTSLTDDGVLASDHRPVFADVLV